ncbi:MAG: DUF3276 family protein [Bacteroidota bacterium]|nr:DUF3276 family protein [Bacteroidota bacterium]MDP4206795.1 DUF3276 family protein [Bacteroidota bacterium]
MESIDKKEESDNIKDEIYSKAVRAGKRTYFFDVKATRRNEFYLTITESKKRFEDEGKFHFEKHKIFLYREDFEKFAEGLQEVVNYIRENQSEEYAEEYESNYSSIEFEDLTAG